jgi:chromosome segregation ATPase
MRSVTLTVLVLLGLSAYAQEEGQFVQPKVRPIGGRAYRAFSIPKSIAQDLDPTQADIIQNRIQQLNEERARLKDQLKDARQEVIKAQKNANRVLDQLDQQDAAFVDYMAEKLPRAQAQEVALRLRLQPIIDWLELTPQQTADLINKQLALLQPAEGPGILDVRQRIAQQARAAAVGDVPETAEERAQKIQLLKQYTELQKQWIANIRAVIENDPQKLQEFNQRYRRTRFALPAGM